MNIIDINNLLFSNSLVTNCLVPTRKRKLIKTKIEPTAKQKENFLGEVIIKGIKKKLIQIIIDPILTKATNTPIFLSTSIELIILLANLSLQLSSFFSENEEFVI